MPTPSPTVAASAGRVTDAVATRDKLLALAPTGSPINAMAEPNIEAWSKNYPGMQFNGSAVAATPTAVSGFAFVTSKKKQQDYLAFAVMDTAGRCAGGILTGTSTKPYTVTGGKAYEVSASWCAGAAVSTAAGY
jgi:hypothetical protein